MTVYCIESFKNALEKLGKKKSYKSLEQEIISYFFNKPVAELISGTRLNNSNSEPYIKKRLEGGGGYRLYFLILVKNDSLYLMFVHPKTGSSGADNIDDNYKAFLYKSVLQSIKDQDLYLLQLNQEQNKIHFKYLK